MMSDELVPLGNLFQITWLTYINRKNNLYGDIGFTETTVEVSLPLSSIRLYIIAGIHNSINLSNHIWYLSL